MKARAWSTMNICIELPALYTLTSCLCISAYLLRDTVAVWSYTKYPKLWNKVSVLKRHLILSCSISWRHVLNKQNCSAHGLCYCRGYSADSGFSYSWWGVEGLGWRILMNICVLTVAEAPFHFCWDEPDECLWISFACVGMYIFFLDVFVQTRPR
jgi:hypothetical protein